MPILMWIVTAIGGALSFLLKHPFVLKMMFFPFFITIILYSVSFFSQWLTPLISGSTVLGYAAYFGALDALSIYLSIITAGFLVRQVLRFVATS